MAARATDALVAASRSGLDQLERMLTPLEQLGGGGELRPLCSELDERLQRDEVVIELAGLRRAEAVEALLGLGLLAPEPAAGVTVRLRAAERLHYSVRWPDGRTERPPPDPAAPLAAALAELDRELAAGAAEERRHTNALQEATRTAAQARAELAHTVAPAPLVPAPRPPAPGRVRLLFRRLLAFLARLFRRQPALPTAEMEAARVLAAAERDLAGRRRRADDAERSVTELEATLASTRPALAARAAEREQRLRDLELRRADHRRQLQARILELTGTGAESFEVEVATPGVPEGVILLLRAPAQLWRETVDARIVVDDASGGDLRDRLEHLRDQRPAEIARRIAAALCDCRNQALDVERRTRQAHVQRVEELTARRVASPDGLRREAYNAAQRPVARQAHQIVEDAATRLESLLAEARGDWEQRIASCTGLEQLRAEVAAIENGAAHRLSLVCDELRETMTVQFVRLVLDLSRTVRQELQHKRLEVARGGPVKLEETFEDVRVALPATLDAAFQPLRAPGVGELLSSERGLLDPLLRTLTREKRSCMARLQARLDEIQRETTRELYASAVFISPLILNRFSGLIDALVGAHQRWIDAHLADEERSFQTARARQEPALVLVPALEQEEARLAALLEAARQR